MCLISDFNSSTADVEAGLTAGGAGLPFGGAGLVRTPLTGVASGVPTGGLSGFRPTAIGGWVSVGDLTAVGDFVFVKLFFHDG